MYEKTLEDARVDSDEVLIEMARKGDRDALARLLDRYRGRAVRTAYAMLNCAEDAEDVAQEAFVNVFKSLRYYKGNGRFFTWLYRIIVNLCISRRRSSGTLETACETIEVSTAAGTPEEIATRRSAVEAVMSRLPAQQRAVLVLREVEELSYVEIAEVMGIAEGTVKYHLSEARRNFRRIWLEEADDEM